MHGPPDPSSDLPSFLPTRILQVDIDQPIPPVLAIDTATGARYGRAISYVRLHLNLIGVVELPLSGPGLTATEHAEMLWFRLAEQINEHLVGDGESPITSLDEAGLVASEAPACLKALKALVADLPLATVVVSTRERPDSLARCLRTILALDYPNFEVIVVDNAPRTTSTFDLMQTMVRSGAPAVRYIREDQPGLSAARNRGLAEARGEVIVFTDDDVLVDRLWLVHLLAGFRRAENVACVTGNIMPAELETLPQLWVEQYVGFGKGNLRRVFDLTENRLPSPLYPYTAGAFGSGANLAFAVQVLREIGGFDPALSTGTVAKGGEDLAAFFTIVTRGYRLVYEPAAIVLHHHHREYPRLRNQMYGYGVGLTAYLTKCVLDEPSRIFDLIRRIPYVLSFAVGRQKQRKPVAGAEYTRSLVRAEYRGMIYGPLAYLRSRWHTRKAQANAKKVAVAGGLRR